MDAISKSLRRAAQLFTSEPAKAVWIFFNPKSTRFFGGSGSGLESCLWNPSCGQTPPCLLLRPRALDLAIFLRFQVASCLLDIYESGWGWLGWRAIMTLMLSKVVVLMGFSFANPWWFSFTWKVFGWNFGVKPSIQTSDSPKPDDLRMEITSKF